MGCYDPPALKEISSRDNERNVSFRNKVVNFLAHGTGDGRTDRVLSDQAIERSSDTVCGLHHARGDEERGFFWLSLKTKVDGLSVIWPQNHWDYFLQFDLKTGGDGFSLFSLKTGGAGFPGLGLKTGSHGLVICASKSPRQFFGLGLKTM
jgi:hypothetical protein